MTQFLSLFLARYIYRGQCPTVFPSIFLLFCDLSPSCQLSRVSICSHCNATIMFWPLLISLFLYDEFWYCDYLGWIHEEYSILKLISSELTIFSPYSSLFSGFWDIHHYYWLNLWGSLKAISSNCHRTSQSLIYYPLRFPFPFPSSLLLEVQSMNWVRALLSVLLFFLFQSNYLSFPCFSFQAGAFFETLRADQQSVHFHTNSFLILSRYFLLNSCYM